MSTVALFSFTKIEISKKPLLCLSIFAKILFSLMSFFLLNSAASAYEQISKINSIKVATFNVSMDATNYLEDGEIGTGIELMQSLENNSLQIRNIAEIIQHVRPDILLLNEFDYIKDPNQGIEKFIKNYLNVSQQSGKPINYPYYYYAPVNTGVRTKFDLDNDGKKSGNLGDAYGFGHFPGHFAMVLLSRYPIDNKNIRTFQKFLWKNMPNAMKPKDPSTGKYWYNDEEWQTLRLSSKSHWDVPIVINNKTIHILASHPTPPVFDGPEDRNGARNHDEIRFWNDYITPEKATYINDDNGIKGGIESNTSFVLLGDQNASPDEGEALYHSIKSLLSNPLINNDITPSSVGGEKHSDSPFAKNHTAEWEIRADYVLPSRAGLSIKKSGIFWPEKKSNLYRLIETRAASSDHRLVWVELIINNK